MKFGVRVSALKCLFGSVRRLAGRAVHGRGPAGFSRDHRLLPPEVHPTDRRPRRARHRTGMPFHLLRHAVSPAAFQLRDRHR